MSVTLFLFSINNLWPSPFDVVSNVIDLFNLIIGVGSFLLSRSPANISDVATDLFNHNTLAQQLRCDVLNNVISLHLYHSGRADKVFKRGTIA